MPQAIAAAIVADLAITGTEAAIATAVIEIAVTVAISVGIGAVESAILGGDQPQPDPPHARRQNFRQAIAPRVRAYGRVRLGGPFGFLRVGFRPGGTDGVLHEVIIFCDGQIDQHEDFYLNDGKVEFETGDHGFVAVPKNYDDAGGHYVLIHHYLGGTAQTADDMLTEDFPDQWTEDHRGLGISYAVMLLTSPSTENFNVVFPSGLPALTSVMRAAKVYDPRDPDQLHNNIGTWKWTSNWALCLLDVLRDPDGLALPWEMFEKGIDVWIDCANYCGHYRPTKDGGSEPWFRLCGAYRFTDPPKKYLKQMLEVADGRIVLRGDGAIVPSIGRWQEPEVTLTSAHVVGYTNFAKGKASPDIRNQINATFISPVYNYVEQQADPFINEDSIDIDGYQPLDIDLTWAPSHAQARVRMKIEAARQDPDRWNGTLILNAYGLKLLNQNTDGSPRRFVRVNLLDEFGFNTTFEIQKISVNQRNGNVTVAVTEMLAEDFDWDADLDEGTAPLIGINESNAGVENPYNLVLTSVVSGVITVTLDTQLTGGLTLHLETRSTNNAVSDRDASWTAMTIVGSGGHSGTLSPGRHDVRAQYEDGDGNFSDPLFIRGIVVT